MLLIFAGYARLVHTQFVAQVNRTASKVLHVALFEAPAMNFAHAIAG
jgi:hypothetical protein